MKRKNLANWIVGFLVMSIIAIPTVSAGIYPDGMISYWKFDEGSGAIAIDSVGANDGMLHAVNGGFYSESLKSSDAEFMQ